MVIVKDEKPELNLDIWRLLVPLSRLNGIRSVNICVPGDESARLEAVIRQPRPGLLRLPRKIRQQIIRLLLVDPGDKRELREIPRFRIKQQARHSLLRVNKQIYQEARAVLYEEGLFGFVFPSWLCSLSPDVIEWQNPVYHLGDRFHMITRMWVKVCVNLDAADQSMLDSDLTQYLKRSRQSRHRTRMDLEDFCRYLSERPPLKLLRVYIIDAPLFRGPRRPNFAMLEPFLKLNGIQVVRFEGDVDRTTALE
jgi:hypothetical protein